MNRHGISLNPTAEEAALLRKLWQADDARARVRRLISENERLRTDPPSVEALAEALPMHRTCSEHIRGHESCLDIARVQWANLRRAG